MASSREFVDYAVGQMQGAGEIRARPMFGEWGLYGDGVFFAVICDNALFVKPTPQGRAAFPQLPLAPPYDGAKDYLLVEELEEREALCRLIRLTCQSLAGKANRKRRK